jgi:hypothetical protein
MTTLVTLNFSEIDDNFCEIDDNAVKHCKELLVLAEPYPSISSCWIFIDVEKRCSQRCFLRFWERYHLINSDGDMKESLQETTTINGTTHGFL